MKIVCFIHIKVCHRSTNLIKYFFFQLERVWICINVKSKYLQNTANDTKEVIYSPPNLADKKLVDISCQNHKK